MSAVSIRPSDFVAGGAVPVDRNLLWKECRFALFDYTRKTGEVVATTCAARITFQDDDGNEYVQHYSASDPERFMPSADGKTLEAVGPAVALSQSSNFYILLNALVSAGFPEDKLEEDISTLDGLYAHHIGVPEPKRSGLARQAPAEGTTERERVISVPDNILKLPWEGKKGVKGAAKGKTAAPVVESSDDVVAEAVAIATALLEDSDSVTRQQVATKAIRDKRPDLAKIVYQDEFQVALLADGFSLDGEDITQS